MSNIPALSLNPEDTGARFMVAKHRSLIAERLGVQRDEYPQGLENQKRLMKLLKAEDPKRYNQIFDIVVRGIDPEFVVGKPDTIIQQQMPQDIVDGIVKTAKTELSLIVNEKFNQFNVDMFSTITDLTDHINKTVAIEAKKIQIVKHEYLIKTPTETKAVKGQLPECFQTVLDLAQARCNILLVGPAGCGKTHLSRVVSESLGLDYAGQSCSAGMSESAFSGWLLPIGDSGKFEYVQSEFVRIYENGGIFLFDEIDAADSNTLLFLNQALANGEFFLPMRYQKPHVKRHKDFVAIAAANTFGNGATAMYSGRNLLDGATMDRFRMGIIPMDYDPKVESELVDPEVLHWGKELRNIINNRNMRKILSTRVLIDASKMKSIGWSIKKIHDTYISDWSKDDRSLINHITATLVNEPRVKVYD
jgi:MoxR-like ATPase